MSNESQPAGASGGKAEVQVAWGPEEADEEAESWERGKAVQDDGACSSGWWWHAGKEQP